MWLPLHQWFSVSSVLWCVWQQKKLQDSPSCLAVRAPVQQNTYARTHTFCRIKAQERKGQSCSTQAQWRRELRELVQFPAPAPIGPGRSLSSWGPVTALMPLEAWFSGALPSMLWPSSLSPFAPFSLMSAGFPCARGISYWSESIHFVPPESSPQL